MSRVLRPSSSEHLGYIQGLIFDGRLRPGERVPQGVIAEVHGFSRMPVREALIAVERGGWVSIEARRGAFVSILDERAVRDHFELAGMVHSLAVVRALSGTDGELAEVLHQIVGSLPRAPESFQHHVATFYRTIVGAARPPPSMWPCRALPGLVPDNFFVLVPDAMQTERTWLPAIVSAMERKGSDQAVSSYKTLLSGRGDQVVAALRHRGILVDRTFESAAALSRAPCSFRLPSGRCDARGTTSTSDSLPPRSSAYLGDHVRGRSDPEMGAEPSPGAHVPHRVVTACTGTGRRA